MQTGTVALRRALIVALATIAALGATTAVAHAEPGSAEAAALAEVVMQCDDGQTDVNFAAVGDLAAALGVATPTAQRVVAARPYLQVSDVLVVEGIGPERLRAIVASGKLCATPPTVPPPSAEACVDDRVDLQAASVAELAERLGISRPAAQRIDGARPFGTMRHVTPERVPGVGKGTLDRVIAASCLTPAPVRTAQTSWRWAYRSQTTTVARGPFKLAVPAGVLDTTGAWASISDASAPAVRAVSGPTADFHVWGPWADGSDMVRVTLPLEDAPDDAADWSLTPAVVHPQADGDVQMRYDANVEIADGTITTGLTSLSDVTSTLLAPLSIISAPSTDPTAGRALRQALGAFTSITASEPTCDPELSGPLLRTEGSALGSAGVGVLDRPLLLWCIAQGDGGSARWRFANNVAAVLEFDSADARIAAVENFSDPLTKVAFQSLDATFPRRKALVPPTAIAHVELDQGTEDSQVQIRSAGASVAPAFLLRQIGQLAPRRSKTAQDLARLWEIFQNCGFDLAQTENDLRNVFVCAVTTATNIGLEAIAEVLSTALMGLDAMFSIGESVSVDLFDPFSLSVTYARPAPTGEPPADQQGSGSDPGAESTAAGRYIVKVADSNESWVLGNDGVLRPIPDTAVYYCNAQVMKVRYNTPRFAVNAAPKGSSATCPAADVPRRRFGDFPGDQRIRSVILRRSNGEAYEVTPQGYRAEILSGETFNCLTTHYLVWDQMTFGEVLEVPAETLTIIPFCEGIGALASAGL